MAAKKVSVGRVLEVLASGRSALAGRDERVVVRVHVDPTCPRAVAIAVRDALVPERASAVVEVRGLSAAADDELPDVALVLVGERPCAPLVESHARSGVSVGMVVEGALDAPRLALPEPAAALVSTVACSSAEALPARLATWLAAACDKPLALAAGFAFCRAAVADALTARCAAENAVVGLVSLIPGSDLPVMTANQAKLALEIAAAYGRDVSPERAAELAGVVAGGVGWRALARAILRAVPGVGALVKAGVGYGGTVATGRALRLRFELEDLAVRQGADERPDGPAAAEPRVFLDAAPEGRDYVTIGGQSA